MTARISVAVVEDDADVLARFTAAITTEPSLHFAFGATRAADLLDWFEAHPVDVLLVDLGLPDMPGVELLRRCHALQPACAKMVVTIFSDEARLLAAMEAGAYGYLLKDDGEIEIARHIRSLHAGGSPMSPLMARRLLERWVGRAADRAESGEAPAGRLSPREAEVLDLVAKGFTYHEIAARLGVSVTTVQTHVRGVYRKLGVHNRTEAVFEARLLGLLP